MRQSFSTLPKCNTQLYAIIDVILNTHTIRILLLTVINYIFIQTILWLIKHYYFGCRV